MKEDSSVVPMFSGPTRLIGLGGYMGAGKDTLAQALSGMVPGRIVIMGMSDPLWQMLCAMDPLIPWHADGLGTVRLSVVLDGPLSPYEPSERYVRAKRCEEVRRLLQRLGTEAGRGTLGNDVWADYAARRYWDLVRADDRLYAVILTGVRYGNEAAMVRANSGKLIWVERPGVEAGGGHSSENSVGARDFDRIVVNDSTVERGARRLAHAIVM